MDACNLLKPTTIELFLTGSLTGTILDVRAPIEYEKGHIPSALSFPLFSTQERKEVGVVYKEEAKEEAIYLALSIVGPRLSEIAKKLSALSESGPLYIYCARGGMRSSSVAWLAELLGLEVTYLEGGYQKYRQWVMNIWSQPWKLRIVGGYTGVGKTELLYGLLSSGDQTIDLEGIANHKGSAFGGLMENKQPTQAQFENDLAKLLSECDSHRPIWIEDESRLVGHRSIPSDFWTQMRSHPVLFVERPLDFRLAYLSELYGEANTEELIACTHKIQRRLGPQNTLTAVNAIENGDLKTAVKIILSYYDRSYQHGLSKRTGVHHIQLGCLDGSVAVKKLQTEWTLAWND